MNLIPFTREVQPQVVPQTLTRLNTQEIEPQIRPQTETGLHGEELVISFPTSWRREAYSNKISALSPIDETTGWTAAFKGFKTSSFENYVFGSVNFRYEQVGSALVQIQTKQVGLGRRFAVNKLDIVFREYEYANKLKYLGVAAVRLQDISVAVVFKTSWSAISGYRKIFENCIKSVALVPTNLQ